MLAEELDVGTVDLDLTSLALGNVLVAAEGSEAPVLGDDDLLATRELVLGAAESLDGGGAVWSIWSAWTLATFHRGNVLLSLVRMDRRIWPMLTRATVPLGLPKAPRIPVWRRSAPAHDNILLIRMTW